MSEFIRHDFAVYSGSIGATGTLVPQAIQLDRDGFQAINCSHWNSMVFQLSGTWSGAVQAQFSMDGTTWTVCPTITAAGGIINTAGSGGPTSNGLYTLPVLGKYFRLQCTSYASGTIIAVVGGTAAYTAYGNTTSVNLQPTTSIGASSWHHNISAASTNATSPRPTTATINQVIVSNNGAAVAYFKLYDKNSAPTVGTDTPIITALVPINGTIVIDGGYAGMRLQNGIAYAITGGMPVADTTAVAAAQVSVAINYT